MENNSLSSNTEEARLQKREILMESGVDPYPKRFQRSIVQAELASKYDHLHIA